MTEEELCTWFLEKFFENGNLHGGQPFLYKNQIREPNLTRAHYYGGMLTLCVTKSEFSKYFYVSTTIEKGVYCFNLNLRDEWKDKIDAIYSFCKLKGDDI